MAYFSDSGMIATVARVLGMWQPGGATARLDHAIWWHHPTRFDDWLIYTTAVPVAHAADSVQCMGINACRGQSECKTATGACKGQNACKGQGWLAAKSAEDCADRGGKVMQMD